MSQATIAPPKPQTMADWWKRLGKVPLERIRSDPLPGTATVDDVVRIEAKENRHCELVDGTLVEKAVGFEESRVAVRLGQLINVFLDANDRGSASAKAA